MLTRIAGLESFRHWWVAAFTTLYVGIQLHILNTTFHCISVRTVGWTCCTARVREPPATGASSSACLPLVVTWRLKSRYSGTGNSLVQNRPFISTLKFRRSRRDVANERATWYATLCDPTDRRPHKHLPPRSLDTSISAVCCQQFFHFLVYSLTHLVHFDHFTTWDVANHLLYTPLHCSRVNISVYHKIKTAATAIGM